MKYLLSWGLLGNTKHIGGFILPSLLISTVLGSFIILMIVSLTMTCTIWGTRLDDSIAMIEDGRFTRRAITSHIVWNSNPVTVDEKYRTLVIHDDKKTSFHIERRALYRKLSDSSLQPMSGSRIIGTKDTRRLDTIHPFVIDAHKVLFLRWSVNNRMSRNTEFAKGYGGIANYEIASSISTHYDWYKDKSE